MKKITLFIEGKKNVDELIRMLENMLSSLNFEHCLIELTFDNIEIKDVACIFPQNIPNPCKVKNMKSP